jgi:SAM-dependent MidA family methyltransferase
LVSKSIAESLGPQHEVTGSAQILRQEAEARGVVSFARFMEVALYRPKTGYYERHLRQIGRSGDFYSSVSVGSLFGALLARRFAEWLEALGPGPLHLVEAGAHDGQLACDILGWLAAHRPALLGRVHYWLIEPSVDRQNRQRLKLENFSSRVECFAGWAAIPKDGVRGVIFSNELLDAFPLHRLAWDAREQRWFEWGVGWDGRRFVWRRMESAEDWSAKLFDAGFEFPLELLAVLPDGFLIELAPAAASWWSAASNALRAGRLLAIDYGLTALERLAPKHASGTLRGYSKHRASADVLVDPGHQDITAHVNFTQLQRAGEGAGLRTEGLFTQSEFLTGIAMSPAEEVGRNLAMDGWAASQVREFQTLTHPEHLGCAFRVLVQARGAGLRG